MEKGEELKELQGARDLCIGVGKWGREGRRDGLCARSCRYGERQEDRGAVGAVGR